MHKKFLIFISIIAISLLTGCAGNIYPYAIKPHVVSGIHYIDTQIPEHMEIDLLVLGNNYERLPPRYNSDIGFVAFDFIKSDFHVAIKTCPYSLLLKGNNFTPPENANDSALISYYLNFMYGKEISSGSIYDSNYDVQKNFGYICYSADKQNCGAVLMTPKKNVVVVHIDTPNESKKENIKNWVLTTVDGIKLINDSQTAN